MALSETEIFGSATGKQYKFGFKSSDAPVISQFTARSFTSNVMPEVTAIATDGEGHAEAIAVSLPSKRKIEISFEGYITESFNELTLANSLTFLSRFFVFQKVGKPIKKGDFQTVTIDYVSHAGITS